MMQALHGSARRQRRARYWRWELLVPPLLAALALALTIGAGVLLQHVGPLVALNVRLYHAFNDLACSATDSAPFYRFMWTGFNQTRNNYIALYTILTAYVLLRKREQWPRLLFVGLVIAALGYASNPIIWHWAWGPRPFTTTQACILYPQFEPAWSSYSSFPSGHARETAAEITAMIIFWPQVWPLAIAYLALLDFSRLYIGVHFPFDVLAGTILGWAIARIAFYAYDIYVAPLVGGTGERSTRNATNSATSSRRSTPSSTICSSTSIQSPRSKRPPSSRSG